MSDQSVESARLHAGEVATNDRSADQNSAFTLSAFTLSAVTVLTAVTGAGNSAMTPSPTNAQNWMHQIDASLSHIWMVRTFLKHCDESSDDEELAQVHRTLYDYMLALGPSLDAGDANKYLRIAHKKFGKLAKSSEWFTEFQPEISGHMNFQMAAKSLRLSVQNLKVLLEQSKSELSGETEPSEDE